MPAITITTGLFTFFITAVSAAIIFGANYFGISIWGLNGLADFLLRTADTPLLDFSGLPSAPGNIDPTLLKRWASYIIVVGGFLALLQNVVYAYLIVALVKSLKFFLSSSFISIGRGAGGG